MKYMYMIVDFVKLFHGENPTFEYCKNFPEDMNNTIIEVNHK